MYLFFNSNLQVSLRNRKTCHLLNSEWSPIYHCKSPRHSFSYDVHSQHFLSTKPNLLAEKGFHSAIVKHSSLFIAFHLHLNSYTTPFHFLISLCQLLLFCHIGPCSSVSQMMWSTRAPVCEFEVWL
jgi:hypothetical protein